MLNLDSVSSASEAAFNEEAPKSSTAVLILSKMFISPLAAMLPANTLNDCDAILVLVFTVLENELNSFSSLLRPFSACRTSSDISTLTSLAIRPSLT